MSSLAKKRRIFIIVALAYPEGGLCSIVSHGKEWLWRAPRPAYWRAPTENDHENGFALRSSVWAAAYAYQNYVGIETIT